MEVGLVEVRGKPVSWKSVMSSSSTGRSTNWKFRRSRGGTGCTGSGGAVVGSSVAGNVSGAEVGVLAPKIWTELFRVGVERFDGGGENSSVGWTG